MAIIVRLDVMKSKELAAAIGISEQNLSQLRQGHVKGVRFETLDKICAALDCKPGDILDRDEDQSRNPVRILGTDGKKR